MARPWAIPSTVGSSSTIQSLRSMREVLRPKLGGDGDGEGSVGFREASAPQATVWGFGAKDSNAAIRDWMVVEGI